MTNKPNTLFVPYRWLVESPTARCTAYPVYIERRREDIWTENARREGDSVPGGRVESLLRSILLGQ